MIGPGKAFDTDRYFIICSNVLGGCQGTTGPGSVNPATGKPYAMSFPVITIRDMVRLQKLLVDSLGIKRLLSVAGGSMGGMQALEWAVSFPEMVHSAIPIATTWRHSAQQIAFNEVGRQAIMADPDWAKGEYYETKPPARGLSVARMVGHITYMSDETMREKFGRRLREKEKYGFDFGVDFEVESYLRYRGILIVSRFDANYYLYITKAEDYFDLTNGTGRLVDAFHSVETRFLVISFTSDWLYPSYQSQEIVRVLRRINGDVAYIDYALELRPRCVSGRCGRADLSWCGDFLDSTARSCRVMAMTPSSLKRGRISKIIAEIIQPGTKVLDLGCGEGLLLAWLAANKKVSARGVEIETTNVRKAIGRGCGPHIRAISTTAWRIIPTTLSIT